MFFRNIWTVEPCFSGKLSRRRLHHSSLLQLANRHTQTQAHRHRNKGGFTLKTLTFLPQNPCLTSCCERFALIFTSSQWPDAICSLLCHRRRCCCHCFTRKALAPAAGREFTLEPRKINVGKYKIMHCSRNAEQQSEKSSPRNVCSIFTKCDDDTHTSPGFVYCLFTRAAASRYTTISLLRASRCL